MAEESKVVGTEEVAVETTDRGLFGFMGKKEEETTVVSDEVIASEFEKVHVSELEEAKVEKEGIFEKLHRSNSTSSSSSSDEEEEGEKGEKRKKKKKGLKEKLKEKISGEEKPEENDTSVPIEKCEGEAVSNPPAPTTEEKKGFLDKIKEKLPGQQKKPVEEVPPPAPAVVVVVEEGEPKAEKKGIFDKIKEKLPGYHPKTTEEEKEKEKESH